MQPLDLRPSLILFLGEDTFASCRMYEVLLGEQAAIQRTLELSPSTPSEEWEERLQHAFDLFTAVEIRRLRDIGLVARDTVNVVPVVIIVQRAVERYSELVNLVVGVAGKQNLADKLEFVTITSTRDLTDLVDLAKHFHDSVSSIESTAIRLQTGVLAICDYWRGARIGSEVQTMLVLARIAALLTLTEYDLHQTHLGQFRNGSLGGRTFNVGLAAYKVDRIGYCAELIYNEILRESVRAFLAGNQISIVGNLSDETYKFILNDVRYPNRGNVTASGMIDDETRKYYQTQAAPMILEAICSVVQSVPELLDVLERTATRLRVGEIPRAISACVVPILFLDVLIGAHLLIATFVLFAAVCGGVLWKKRQERFRRALLERVEEGLLNPPRKQVQLYDPALAQILEDLRRELIGSLGAKSPEVTSRPRSANTTELLLGEQIWGFEDMRKCESARAKAREAFVKSSQRLVLLSLETGKWGSSSVCAELVALRTQVIEAIVLELREEFSAWAMAHEGQRLADRTFVAEVLYAPTPPAQAPVFTFFIAPPTWTAPAKMPADRGTLSDSYHFLYLVERQ